MFHFIFILMGLVKFQFVLLTATIFSSSLSMSIDCFIASVLNIFIFTNLASDIKKVFKKIFRPRKFSRISRWIVRIKKRSGFLAVSVLTPIFFGYPLGCLILNSMTKNKWKIYKYLLISSFSWISILFLLASLVKNFLQFGFSEFFQ